MKNATYAKSLSKGTDDKAESGKAEEILYRRGKGEKKRYFKKKIIRHRQTVFWTDGEDYRSEEGYYLSGKGGGAVPSFV